MEASAREEAYFNNLGNELGAAAGRTEALVPPSAAARAPGATWVKTIRE